MQYGLSDRTIDTLYAIFRKYSGIKQAILYGSRAKGNYRRGSDIDLTLKTGDDFTLPTCCTLPGILTIQICPTLSMSSSITDCQTPR